MRGRLAAYLQDAAAVQAADRQAVERGRHQAAPAPDDKGVHEDALHIASRRQHGLRDAAQQQAVAEQGRWYRQQRVLCARRRVSASLHLCECKSLQTQEPGQGTQSAAST